MLRRLSRPTLFPYTTLFRSQAVGMEALLAGDHVRAVEHLQRAAAAAPKDGFVQGHYGSALLMNGQAKKAVAVLEDRKSTRLNSSHVRISYAVFCLKKKKQQT